MNISALKNKILTIIATLICFCIIIIAGSVTLAHQSPRPEPFITLSSGNTLRNIPPQSYCNPSFHNCIIPRAKLATFPFTPGKTTIISLPKEIYLYPWNYYVLFAGTKEKIAARSQFYSGLQPNRTIILHSPREHPILAVEMLVYSLVMLNHQETAVIRGHWIIRTEENPPSNIS